MKSTVQDRNGADVPANSQVVAQTFRIPDDSTDQILEKIFILCQTSLPKNSPMKFSARLVDLGESPSLEEYDAGKNLFPEGSTFEIATPGDRNSAQIVGFTFTGEHRVTLKKGHTYAFEIILDEENPPSSSVVWLRGGISPSLPESPVFNVCITETSKPTDPRVAMTARQAFIGVKTSPAK